MNGLPFHFLFPFKPGILGHNKAAPVEERLGKQSLYFRTKPSFFFQFWIVGTLTPNSFDSSFPVLPAFTASSKPAGTSPRPVEVLLAATGPVSLGANFKISSSDPSKPFRKEINSLMVSKSCDRANRITVAALASSALASSAALIASSCLDIDITVLQNNKRESRATINILGIKV